MLIATLALAGKN